MIAPRYLPAICGLVALALIPTLVHSYSRDRGSDGLHSDAIPDSLADYAGRATTRNATWGKRRFDSDDWLERTYTHPGGDEVILTVVRSYDPKRLYHHPELAIAYGTNFDTLQTRPLTGRPELPVHVLSPAPGVNARAIYALHYDGRFIEDPIMFQIRTAGELLFSKRKPMTIFFVLDPSVPPDTEIDSLGASRLLFAAIDSFLEQSARETGPR